MSYANHSWVKPTVSPANTVDVTGIAFPQTSPASFAGATFSPNLPADPDTIYVGTDNSLWTHNGAQYVTYVADTKTEWAIDGTTTDAGANKTGRVRRQGPIVVGPALATTVTSAGNAEKISVVNDVVGEPTIVAFKTQATGFGATVGAKVELTTGTIPAMRVINNTPGAQTGLQTTKAAGGANHLYMDGNGQVIANQYTASSSFAAPTLGPLSFAAGGAVVSGFRQASSGLLVAGVIPTGYSAYADSDGFYVANIELPLSGPYPGFDLTFKHEASFNTTISVNRSDMLAPLVVTAAMTGAAWKWSGTKWMLLTRSV